MASKFFDHPRLALIAAVLLLGSLLAACGDTPTATPVPPTATAASGAAPTAATGGGAAQEIAVTLNEWSITPADIQVPAGHVKFKVTNAGKFPHNFKIVVNGQQQGTANINGGASAEYETDLTAGTYDTLCAIPGHKDQGMAGKVTVK